MTAETKLPDYLEQAIGVYGAERENDAQGWSKDTDIALAALVAAIRKYREEGEEAVRRFAKNYGEY